VTEIAVYCAYITPFWELAALTFSSVFHYNPFLKFNWYTGLDSGWGSAVEL
jgi:hypothetical protein